MKREDVQDISTKVHGDTLRYTTNRFHLFNLFMKLKK